MNIQNVQAIYPNEVAYRDSYFISPLARLSTAVYVPLGKRFIINGQYTFNTTYKIKVDENIENNFSLIVIDNVTDLFSYEYQKDESIFEKNSLFMKYMHNLAHFAISNRIPIVVTNMIRNLDGKEIENMKSAIDPFTHIKIHLTKNSSKFNGKIYSPLLENSFSYTIDKSGLSSSEDI